MNRTNRLLCSMLLGLGMSVTTFAERGWVVTPRSNGPNGRLPTQSIPGVPDKKLERVVHSRLVGIDGITRGGMTWETWKYINIEMLESSVGNGDRTTARGLPRQELSIQNRYEAELVVINDPRYFTLPKELRPSMKDAWGSGILDFNHKDSFFGFHPEFLHKTSEETLELVFSKLPVELRMEIPEEKRPLYDDLESISVMYIPQWMFSYARNDMVRKLSEPDYQIRYVEKYGLKNLKLALLNLSKYKVADISLRVRQSAD